MTPALYSAGTDSLPVQLWMHPDGRVLEWLECGDPAGYPLLFFHGFLGSVRQAYIADAIAKQEGIRIIAVNRPGTGQSSPHMHGSMIDHARDVLALARHLGIEEAASCGFSNGAGYALACAAAAPGKIRFSAVCSPLGPLSQSPFFWQLHWLRKFMVASSRYAPVVTRSIMKAVRSMTLRHPAALLPMLNNAAHSSVDPAVRKNEPLIRAASDSIVDSLRPEHSAQSLTHEIALCYRWGFDPRSITQRVYLWHGMQDDVSSLKSAHTLADVLPNVRADFRRGDHVLILSVLPHIMHVIAREAAGMPVTPAMQHPDEREHAGGLIPGMIGARY